MYTKLVPKIIQEKLKAKERALSFESNSRNFGEQEAGAILAKDIQSRTTFVRMCSNKLSVPNKIIAGGEFKDRLNSEGDIINKMLFGKELYEKKKNGQIRPVSGLKSIDVNYKGSFKAIREAVVNWTVGSIDDLEELTPYFLTVGKTVALDWGWVNSNTNYSKMFNGVDPFITFDSFLQEWNVNQDIFTNPQYKIQHAGGDYDAIAGKISNFETTLRQDGGFDCVTKITAIGAALFQKPIDKPSNQIQVETKNHANEKKKKKKVAYDSDNLMNAIINLRGIILTNYFNTDNPLENLKNNLRNKKNYGDNHVFYGKLYGFAVDNISNPNVLWMNRKGTENIFVKWGWMEDQLLNRYISIKSGEDNDIKMTIRSIDTVIDEDTNLPILTEDKAEELNVDYGDVSYDASTVFYEGDSLSVPETNSYQVKAGDSLSAIAGKLGVDINQLVETNIQTLLPSDVYSGNDGSSADNLFSTSPFEVSGPSLPGQDVNELDGIMVGTDFISRLDYGYLNLQPGQVLFFTLIKAVVEGDAEKSNVIGNVEIEDENTSLALELSGIKSKTELLKTPTVIKNMKKFLKPIEPYKFFSTELLPKFEEINQRNFGNPSDEKYSPLTNLLFDQYRKFQGTYQDPEFETFWKALLKLKNKKFTKPNSNGGLGRLRYMWVNITEIQKAFGITYTDNDSTKPNISPKGTVEKGLKALLSQLNKNFYDFWNFELTVDTYDSTNIKVIDTKATDLSKESMPYTKYKNNNSSHIVSNLGIYKFPTFKAGSIVKSQNLSFKIPDSMAITIMFGSNKSDKDSQPVNAFNNPDIMKLFGGDEMKENSSFDEWSDRYLSNITTPAIANSDKKTFVKVGSQNSSHNSKITENFGITIQPQQWWQEWVGENQISRNNPIGEEAPRTKFGILNEEIIFMKEESYEKSSITTGTQTSSERSAKSEGQDTQYGAKN